MALTKLMIEGAAFAYRLTRTQLAVRTMTDYGTPDQENGFS
jgi:hypothetical protein